MGIAYIYCIYNETGQTIGNFLASLLQQLCRQKSSLSPEIVASEKDHSRFGTRPTDSEFSRLVTSQIPHFTKVFIVVDALDECPQTEKTKEELLSELQKLPSNVHLLVTSRPDNIIGRDFAEAVILRIHAQDDDVHRYLTARISTERLLTRYVTDDPSLQSFIIRRVTERTQGMYVVAAQTWLLFSAYGIRFLLAKLHMDLLASENSRRDLGRALDSLPDKLDETYNKAMLRLRSQEPVKTKCAFKVLSWVLFAQRPLEIEELRCAFAVEENDLSLAEEALPDADSLLSVCGGLIVVDDSEVVRFIHFTAQQYFNRASHSELSSAHAYLTTVCITYLSFPVFASGACGDSSYEECDRLQERLEENVILGYAAKHWGDHVRECCDVDPTIHAMARKFLTRKANVSCATEAAHHERLWRRLPRCLRHAPRDVTDLHIAAAFGLEKMTKELLEQGACVDAHDSQAHTPLYNASTNGHVNTIKCLLEAIAISDPESTDRHRYNAMKQAAVAGHEPATRFLLNKGVSSYDMRDVVFKVAGEGHSDVLRILLESLKDDDKASCMGSAIIRASTYRHETSVRLLLEQGKGIEINDIQPYLSEAIFKALETRDSVIVQMLLKYGANIEAVNAQGDRPIHHQSLWSFPDDDWISFKYLLDKGADVNIYGSDKKTPLMTASRLGWTDLLEQLLDHGADTLAKDKVFNRTSVEWAAIEGHPHVVKMLSTS